VDSAAKKIKTYKFADQLSFINKYFEERKSKTNIEYENDQEQEENMQPDSEEQLPEEDILSQPSLTLVQTNEIHVPIKTTKQKCLKTSVSQPTTSARLMDYLISKKKRKSNFHMFATPSRCVFNWYSSNSKNIFFILFEPSSQKFLLLFKNMNYNKYEVQIHQLHYQRHQSRHYYRPV